MSLWPEIRAAKNGEFWVPVGVYFSVNGTGVPDPFGPGFAADLGREMERVAEGMYLWQPIGYPAATVPMRPSILTGAEELVQQILRYERVFRDRGWLLRIMLGGYSQGAIVVMIVWLGEILNPNGRLHHLKDNVLAMFTWGDPMRCPGIANGNKYAGRPLPQKLDGYTTGGIAGPGDLTPEQTPDFLLSFANDGDLYASAPVGATPWRKETQVGHNETLIYEAVLDFNGHDILAFAKEMVEIVSMPLTQILPLIQAIWNGLKFLGQGTNAPHWTYDIGPAVRYLIDAGNKEWAAA